MEEKYTGNVLRKTIYVWCYLGNFGGNSMMIQSWIDVDVKIEKLFVEGGENVYGLGATLEGFDVNPFYV
ncbi:alpha-N-acetylglucosaminidase TIM-barrel domain-containing protein [Bacteroides thetaiotaomicron]|uniref:alpha-N-acetylglucosaminidase TIM-barrel domain-containing protein n=1 Tax=Bacteroides thetaiotaomicron TaxID=818 RepID=UPI0028699E0C|nr:alpha-N-acetylglucosaminidase TIM-barrel domain-containing protein [Bacteroides thetaiotaomicron]